MKSNRGGRKPVPVRIVNEPASTSDPYRPKDSEHMSIRQIDNGYIVNRHGYRNGKHFDVDVYTPTAPKIDIPNRGRSERPPGRSSRLDGKKI